jgi:hypothetical protein
MVVRVLGVLFAVLFLTVDATANSAPQVQVPSQKILIPFEPPFGESLRYRSEIIEQRDDKTRLSWSVDNYRFEEAKDGYRLIVEPVSHGSSDKDDPAKVEFLKKIEELTKLPFVLRLNEDAEIVEVERGDEYWAKMIKALREVLNGLEPKRPGQDKMVESLIGLYESMPAESRLAKLTETIRPLVEFAWSETTIGKSIVGATKTTSPLGPVKQEFAIPLTKVSDGFAYLTFRSGIPPAELKKLTEAMFDKMNNGAFKPEEITKIRAQLAAAKDFNAETVAEYKISTEDGLLETFHSTQTVTMTDGDKRERRIKILSMRRMD